MDHTNNGEERSYTAFISYRHMPLDKEAAERVQKKIENYIVPKEYREQAGGKKLGRCFRDEDELPASSSLSDSIRQALDQSRFLIVICTPDLPGSKWCEAEIRYFLKDHDRDHVLAVLADGDPEESFSPYLLHDYDEEGRPVSDIEPLAANIAGTGHRINKKVFHKEITRLCAAMIGCPFDALWQRERRTRTNRLLTGAVAAAAVLAVFLGIVLNRNAQIAAQNVVIEEQNTALQAQLSSVLVDSGIQKLEGHDVKGALEDALASLESNDPQIYDHRAEKLLADALGAYKTGQLQTGLVYRQTTDIQGIEITQDKRYAILSDQVGTIRCLDLSTFEVAWEFLVKDKYAAVYTGVSPDCILVKEAGQVICLSLTDGSVLWSYEQDSPNYCQCISEDGSLFAVLDTKPGEEGAGASADGENDLFRPVYVIFLDTKSGREIGRSELSLEHYGVETLSDAFKPRNYGTAFSSNNRFFFLSFCWDVMDDGAASSYMVPCFTVDTKTLESTLAGSLIDETDEEYYLCDLYYGSEISNDGRHILFAKYFYTNHGVSIAAMDRAEEGWDTSTAYLSHSFDYNALAENDYYEILHGAVPALFSQNHMLIFMDRSFTIYDRNTRSIRWSYTMDSSIRAASWTDRETESLEFMTQGGQIFFRTLGREEAVLESGKSREIRMDQDNILLSVPYRVKTARNAESGYLTVSAADSGKLYQVSYISDPSGQSIVEDCGSASGLALDQNPLLDRGLILTRADSEKPAVYLYDRRTGMCDAPCELSGQAGSYGIFMTDERHFAFLNELWSLEDGNAARYVAFPERESSAFTLDTMAFTTRLADGRLMSSGIGLETKNDTAVYYYPVWIDGVFAGYADELSDPYGTYDGESYNGYIPLLGKSGVIMLYGKDTSKAGHSRNEFRLRSIDPEETWYFKNEFSETEEFIPALATRSRQLAVLYENGTLCLYDPGREEPVMITGSQADAFSARNETIGLCYSDGDDYLLSLTSSGIIRVIDLETKETHSFTSEAFRRYTTKIEDMIRSLFGYTDFLRAWVSGDKKSLFVFCGQESSTCRLMIIDTKTWEIQAEADDVLAWDPEYNRIYAYAKNQYGRDQSAVISYEVHTLEDLREWAGEVVGSAD